MHETNIKPLRPIMSLIHYYSVLLFQVLTLFPTPGELQVNGDLRLAGEAVSGNLTDGTGRLEIFLGGRWGTINAGLGLNKEAADTACRQLGYDLALVFGTLNTVGVTAANESTPILMNNLTCPDNEKPFHVLRCSYSTITTDSIHYLDAAVQCDVNYCEYDTQLRLIDRNWTSSGVLQVYIAYFNAWDTSYGAICYTADFNQNTADSACRQMGFTSAINYTGVEYPSWRDVWLSSAKCSSSKPCFRSCFEYPTTPGVWQPCPGNNTVVFLQCTFDVDKKDSVLAGNETMCGFEAPAVPDNTPVLFWIGLGALILALIIPITTVVIAAVVCIVRKSRHHGFIEVDTFGEDNSK